MDNELPAPQLNEVWLTNSGNLVLIVASPWQYHEIEIAPLPVRVPYAPAVFPKRKTTDRRSGMMMLWYDRIDGWTVSELECRLKEKVNLTPADFFARDMHSTPFGRDEDGHVLLSREDNE